MLAYEFAERTDFLLAFALQPSVVRIANCVADVKPVRVQPTLAFAEEMVLDLVQDGSPDVVARRMPLIERLEIAGAMNGLRVTQQPNWGA